MQGIRIGHQARVDVVRYLKKIVAQNVDPRKFEKPLKNKFSGLWRYRTGDYRMICQLREVTPSSCFISRK